MHNRRDYLGRFAPTPSGPLHFGSLTTALASWLDARCRGGVWHVRIENIDTPRCSDKAASTILRQLERFGLYWDGQVLYQHTRSAAYQEALDRLIANNKAYPCTCSRRETKGFAHYPGWCRQGVCHPERHAAVRLRTDAPCQPAHIRWHDRRHGAQQCVTAHYDDVILKRRDGLWAYQLAVVVDDAMQGVTDIVRGEDLFDNTPWQRVLQDNLNFPQPNYLHLPLMRAANGQKLSKQNKAPALPKHDGRIRALLYTALCALKQRPPQGLSTLSVSEQLQWAQSHWHPEQLNSKRTKIGRKKHQNGA